MGDGAEGIHISEMVAAFRDAGHTVYMVGPSVGNEGISGKQTKSGFSWIKKLFRGPLYELVEISYNVFGFFWLRKAIKSHKPDLIYDRYMTFNYSCVAAGRRYRLPVFIEVNAPLALERDKESDEKLYLKRVAYWLERKICADADHVFAVSTPLKKYLVTTGVPTDNITVLPNGVNRKKFFPRPKCQKLLSELGLTENDVVVGFLGILRPWHGIEMLLSAIKKVCQQNDKCNLLLVGDGPIRDEIITQADECGLKGKLVITGRVPHDRVPDYIALFDIAVSPKATFYASPMKIVEYMAMGKPVIVPDSENIRDLIEFGEEGLCFKPTDSKELSEQLVVAVGDSFLRVKIANNAKTKVERSLSWENNVKIVTDKYAEIQ
jgi:glycosyltransferase involved in cell wall biosynthesis